MNRLSLILLLSLSLVWRLHATLSANVVWEVRSTGSNNNGGGFVTGASGTDFSQQNSAQYALTGVTTSGAGATFLTASAATDMVGNIARVVSGSNFTAGWYEIISVVAGVSVTCDANVCTGAGSSGVINIGGALASMGAIGSASANQGMVAGNIMYVKGSFTMTTTTDTIACSGSSTLPIRILGYNSTRGDGYQGRTNSYGKLITANMPTITYTTGRLNQSGSFVIMESLHIITAINNVGFVVGADSIVRGCRFVNSGTGASASGYTPNSRSLVIDSDCFLTGASGGLYGGAAVNPSVVFDSCQFVITSTTPDALNLQSSGTAINNIIHGSGGRGIYVASTTWSGYIRNNTVQGCGSSGIAFLTGSTVLNRAFGNMSTDNGAYGFDLTAAGNAVALGYNRTRDNTSGAVNSGAGWRDATLWGQVTTDTGTSSSDYTDVSNGDFTLVSTSPATSVNIPAYGSIGAAQRSQTGSGGGQKSYVVP